MPSVTQVSHVNLIGRDFTSNRIESIAVGVADDGRCAVGIVSKGSTIITWFIIELKDLKSFMAHFKFVSGCGYDFDFPETYILAHYDVVYSYIETIGNRSSYLALIEKNCLQEAISA